MWLAPASQAAQVRSPRIQRAGDRRHNPSVLVAYKSPTPPPDQLNLEPRDQLA